MHDRLDYRGLRRWSMLILFPVLLISSWVAALLMILFSLPVTFPAFSATAIAGLGIVGVAAVIIPPVIGTLAGLWGIAFGKQQVIRAFGATRVPDAHPLVQVTHRMADRLGMPGPEVYVYPDDDINAWATGQSASTAAIGITRGALNKLTREQIDAVIGHELGHIAAADTRRLHFARSFQNALVWFFGFRSWRWKAQHVFGFVGQMGIMGLSRRREYWADAVGALLTSPQTMQDALRAVARDAQRPTKARKYYNHLMFNWPGSVLLSSHPTMQQRLDALDDGAFYDAVLRKTGGASSRARKQFYSPSRAGSGLRERLDGWLGAFEQNPVALTAVPVLLLTLIGSGAYYVAQLHSNVEALVVQEKTHGQGPQVAGWSGTMPAESVPALPPREPPKALPKVAALPVYPKEPRYEPDEATGDGELTPYQALVEDGVACIYRSKPSETFQAEHFEDAGPDHSDVMGWSLPQNENFSAMSLGLVKMTMTDCWKKHGGVLQGSTTQRQYEVWVLTDAQSGATAECGVWTGPMRLPSKRGAMAGYCR